MRRHRSPCTTHITGHIRFVLASLKRYDRIARFIHAFHLHARCTQTPNRKTPSLVKALHRHIQNTISWFIWLQIHLGGLFRNSTALNSAYRWAFALLRITRFSEHCILEVGIHACTHAHIHTYVQTCGRHVYLCLKSHPFFEIRDTNIRVNDKMCAFISLRAPR